MPRISLNGNRQWLAEAKTILEQLDGEVEADKKKATIRDIALALALGTPKTRVFRKRRTGSATIYYEKWRKQELFARVEQEVLDLVRAYQEEAELDAIREAIHIQRMAGPQAAKKIIALLDAKSGVYFEGERVATENDHHTQRLAAKQLLDYITANLPTTAAGDRTRLTDRDLTDLIRQAADELDEYHAEDEEAPTDR